MKITLACLAALALPYVALADHYLCTRVYNPLAGQMVHVVIIDKGWNVIMKESKNFFMVSHFTIKNSRGRFDMPSLGKEYSAAFDGYDWGSFTFKTVYEKLSSEYKIGCYGGSDFCSNEDALRKKCFDLLG